MLGSLTLNLDGRREARAAEADQTARTQRGGKLLIGLDNRRDNRFTDRLLAVRLNTIRLGEGAVGDPESR